MTDPTHPLPPTGRPGRPSTRPPIGRQAIRPGPLVRETWLEESAFDRCRELTFGGRIADLATTEKQRQIPRSPGVYLIVNAEGAAATTPDFVTRGTGGAFKGKDPNVPIDVLQKKWVTGTRVLYIGKAGGRTATLASRLRAYLRFGEGVPVAHWGGRFIWQLPQPSELLVYWMELGQASPRAVELQMLQRFEQQFGRLPFANLRR